MLKSMIGAFGKHVAEFSRYLRNRQFEETDSGILFPRAHAEAAGFYEYSTNDGLVERAKNLITTEGLNHLLDVTLHAGTRLDTWYLALYQGNYTPVAGLTAATFAANATENTSTTEGYTETTRQEWVESAPASGSTDNSASQATFTFASAASVSIYGAAMLSSATRGGTTGKCMSAAKFPAARTFYDTDVFKLTYTVSLTSS